MNQKAVSHFQKLEHQRLELIALLSAYNDEILNKKPSPEAWSVVQVILHLMRAEAASVAYMKKKLSHTNKIPNASVLSVLRKMTLNFAFYLPLKFKAPAVLDNLPEYTSFNDVKNQWASERLELQDFLDFLPEKMFNSELWRHPLVGKMNIYQMLDFFYDHSDRHLRQIYRTLKEMKNEK